MRCFPKSTIFCKLKTLVKYIFINKGIHVVDTHNKILGLERKEILTLAITCMNPEHIVPSKKKPNAK